MKKGLTLLLAFIMVFTMQAATVSAASFTDTVGAPCETAAEVLSALGIVEGKAEGSYEPDSSLTRAEMATIILRAMNMAQGAKGQDIFTDVPASHWAYANVSAAYQMGIVNGTSETTFAPDATVTYEQAVKMVVAALGYTVEAEAMGGYPTGYLAKAAHLDVLKGVSVGGDMTRGNMAILMYNALDKPLLEKASFGEDSYKYGSDASVTMLTRYLKVQKITGKVVQTPMACADGAPSRVLSDEVRVSDGKTTILMKKGESRAQELLGVRAEILYRMDEITDMPIIISAVARASSEVVDIAAKDIDAGKTTNAELVYEKDGKDIEADIAGATLVYNGRVRAMDASLLKPEIGTVRLVSETGAEYDLVIVESYKNYIVDTVLTEDCIVYFKDGAGSMVVDFSDNSINTVMTDEKGAALTLDDVAEWDILSVSRDNDAKPSVCRIYRTYQTVEGTVTELSVSEKELVIDETAYPIAYSMKMEDLKLGKKAAYHLDFTGAVAAVTEAEDSSRVYAWLSAAQNTKGMDPVPQLKMFTQDAEWKVFKTTDYVEYNGDRVAAKDLLSTENAREKEEMYDYGTAPTLVDSTGKVEPQLVAYEVNEEGLLTKIETAYNLTKLDTSDEDKVGGTFSMDYYKNDARQARFFDGTKGGSTNGQVAGSGGYNGPMEYSGGTMFTRVFVRAETKYFIVPGDLTNEKAYFVKKATSELTLESNRTDTTDCLSFYDIGENYVCGAMVLRKDIQSQGSSVDDSVIEYSSYDKPAGLVLGVSKTLNEDGLAVTTLKIYTNSGQEVLLNAEEVEYVQYRNANARMYDKKEDGVVVKKGDPAWYMLTDDGEKYRPSEESNEIYRLSKGTPYTRKNEIFMDFEDLAPGDVIHYEADDSGKLVRVSVIFRCAYPGEMEFAYGANNLSSTGTMNFYRGGNLSINGIVLKALDSGLLTEVTLGQGSEADSSVNLGIHSKTVTTRMLPTSGKFALWDTKRQEMRAITAADVVQGDFIYSWWQTTRQNLFIVYR